MHDKSFLITIDTEGDNLWEKQKQVTTRNEKYLPRFQLLCEKYQLKPTYLTNWEMVNSPFFVEFGKDVLARNVGEIGMHLHPWDMPPNYQLTFDDLETKPYLIEYPYHIMRDKISIMTDRLEDTFQCKMRSHRAGRWSFNEKYASILIEYGYNVDCSVTPNCTWENNLGDPQQRGGTDYTSFPERSYFIDLSNISKEGASELLEVPMTIIFQKNMQFVSILRQFARSSKIFKRLCSRLTRVIWLRPTGYNMKDMIQVVDCASAQHRNYIEFMLHSSELMPGGSPLISGGQSADKLFDEIETVFQYATPLYKGRTLNEYYLLQAT